jgi:hypothetical protein
LEWLSRPLRNILDFWLDLRTDEGSLQGIFGQCCTKCWRSIGARRRLRFVFCPGFEGASHAQAVQILQLCLISHS